MTRTRRTFAAPFATLFATLFVAGATAVATAVPAHADTGPVPRLCPIGYVCVNPVSGLPILVPEGGKATFTGGVKATIANRTRLTYCVGGTLSFVLPPNTAVTELRDIRVVAPQPTGGACVL